MKRVISNGLELWEFENLGRESGIKHFVSSRKSFVNGKEFTLSFSSSPDKEEIRTNRNMLASALTIDPSKLIFPSQVHKTRIVHVTAQTAKEELMETDALITHEHGLCIAVMSADCVPVLLYDKRNNAVAAVHSGWRGTVAKIVTKTMEAMTSLFGTLPKDIIAGIGPSVCQDSYEVGEEVIEEVRRSFGPQSDLMIPQAANKAKLDLWKANKLQLVSLGVPEGNIEISNLCTVKNNDHFFSARKGDSGRFAAGIMLR